MSLLQCMEEEGVSWDEITLASAIDACTKAKQGARAHELLQTMYKRNMTPEPMSITQVRKGVGGGGKAGSGPLLPKLKDLCVVIQTPLRTPPST